VRSPNRSCASFEGLSPSGRRALPHFRSRAALYAAIPPVAPVIYAPVSMTSALAVSGPSAVFGGIGFLVDFALERR
jgi:hypothetical protein